MIPHECNVVRVLRDARALIAQEQNWLISGYAEDAMGRWRPVGTPEAQRFSVAGALVRASRGCRACTTAARQVMREAAPELSLRCFGLGDHGGSGLRHDDALVLFDAALSWIERRSQGFEAAPRT
jgi:hypothetical protein